MRTDIDILKWVRSHLVDSELAAAVTGRISDRGRPAGSTAEDIVISVLANEGCADIQRAYVNVNIYVSDLWNAEAKDWERDTKRLQEVCQGSAFLFHLNDSGLRVSPADSSQRCIKIDAEYEDGHTEHVVNNKLLIQISNY